MTAFESAFHTTFVTLGLFWSFMSFENYDQHLIRHCIEQPQVISFYLVGWLIYMMIPASIVVGCGLVFRELSAFDLFIVSLMPGLIVALASAPAYRPLTSDAYQKVINRILFQREVRWQAINFCFIIIGCVLGAGTTELLI